MGVGTLCGGEALGGPAESAAGKAVAAAASVALSFCEKEKNEIPQGGNEAVWSRESPR